jgi:uncharacterized protein
MTVTFVITVAVLLGLLLFFVRRSKRLGLSLGAITFLIALLVLWGFLVEPNRLIVRQQTIQLANWPSELSGLKVAVISDIHADGWAVDDKKLRLIVERTNQLNPELIVILGDYISSDGMVTRRVQPEEFAAVLKNLHAPHGVYSVLGNHDWWYNGAKVRGALEQNGIKVLENEVVRLEVRGTSMCLAGLSDLWTRPQKMDETIDKVPQAEPMIALAHNPDIFPKLPQRVPLLLAGHTHGGQVRFPFIGSVVHSSDFGERYTRGLVFENNHHLFVTTGIGTSILPVRFGVPPEIVLLTLNSQ